METPITSLRAGAVAQITALLGKGCSFQRKLRTMGIRGGKKLNVVAIHPFAGPLVLEYESYAGATLNDSGKRLALELKCKHKAIR